MATISKFYFHDAATTNTGTMPTGAFFSPGGSQRDGTGDAATARTARAATATIGTNNPDISISFTSTANTLNQNWGFRRFVSAPLAAVTLTAAQGNWTHSYARSESNTNHNMSVRCVVSGWRPSTGASVGANTNFVEIIGAEPGSTSVEAEAVTATINASTTLLDGDILVFEISDVFQQAMATAYNGTYEYDGTTEASITTCASFVTPPIALTLFDVRVPRNSAINHQDPAVLMEGMEQDKRNHLWLPKRKIWRPRIEIPQPAFI